MITIVKNEIEFYGEYTLRFNWRAFIKLTKALNAPSFADFDKIMAQLGPDEMTSLVWAGLLHKFPNMTLDEVSDIIDDYLEEHTMEDLLEVVMSTIKESSIFRRPDMGETPTVSHTPMTEATENKKKNMKHSTT